MSNFEFVGKIFQLLKDEGVFEPPEGMNSWDFIQPEELEKALDLEIGIEGLPEPKVDEILKDIVKYSIKPNHQFYQHELSGGYDPHSLAATWIATALNNCHFTYEAGPVFTLVEIYLIKKLLEIFEFPPDGDGVFCSGGSQGNMYGLVMARQRYCSDIKFNGLYQQAKLIAYTSEDSHYSIGKSVNWLGLGMNNCRSVKCNFDGTMNLEDLERLVKKDIEAGNQPFFVNATAGTTIFGAMDDISGIAEICEKYGIWLHVDATLGGHLKFSKTHSDKLDFKRADSLIFSPQKTLGTGVQCVAFLIKAKELLVSTNSTRVDYLFRNEKLYDTKYDIGDKSILCGRSIDSLKLWMMLKCQGYNGVEKLVDNAMTSVEYFRDKISETPGFRLVIPHYQFTNVCFWYIPNSLRNLEETEEWWDKIYKLTKKIKEEMELKGKLFISCNSLPQRKIGYFFRLPIKCCPPMLISTLDQIIQEIEEFGERNYEGI